MNHVDTRYFDRHEPTISEGVFWWFRGIWIGNRFSPISPWNRIEPIEDEV